MRVIGTPNSIVKSFLSSNRETLLLPHALPCNPLITPTPTTDPFSVSSRFTYPRQLISLSFVPGLLLLSTILSRSIPVAAYSGIPSFSFWRVAVPHCVYLCLSWWGVRSHCMLINAAANVLVEVLVGTYVFFLFGVDTYEWNCWLILHYFLLFDHNMRVPKYI